MLMSKMIEGFPEHIKQLPVVLRPFWQIRDDLSIERSYIAYQGRYYIPKAIKRTSLSKSPHRPSRYVKNEAKGTTKYVLVRY